ncbi:MAG: hypothetical protein GY795_36150, partial [Desulfobacterales bacterium]|nr:hypothetical protein [Desulfobacterales bacterium]
MNDSKIIQALKAHQNIRLFCGRCTKYTQPALDFLCEVVTDVHEKIGKIESQIEEIEVESTTVPESDSGEQIEEGETEDTRSYAEVVNKKKRKRKNQKVSFDFVQEYVDQTVGA